MPKISFIGAGRMSIQHALAFSNISDVTLSGVHSRSSNHAQDFAKKFSIPHVCHSIENLWSVTNSDLLVVSVPPSALLNVALEALKYPWHSLFEKPLGLNLGEAQVIAEASKQYKSNAFLGLNRRHMSSTTQVLDSLPPIGSTRIVSVFDQQNPLSALKHGHPQSVVNNWHFANSIHTIDYFSLFCRGKLLSTQPVTPSEYQGGFFKCSSLLYDSGDYGLYMGLWEAPGPWGVSVSTKELRFDMLPLERASMRSSSERVSTDLPIDQWDIDFKPGFRRQAQLFVESLDEIPSSLPTVLDGLNTMKTAHRLFNDSQLSFV